MCDLPPVIECAGWEWEPFTNHAMQLQGFWIGYDKEGNRWLTKLHGAFHAYREIVFATLAQEMGWSCQSSVFLSIDKDSAKLLGVCQGEIHAAHWFLTEHQDLSCGKNCPHLALGNPISSIEDLLGVGISCIVDWPKSEYACHLFGGSEPPDRLFTTAHELVIIDSEMMFAAGPSNFETSRWWNEPNGSRSAIGRALALEVCIEFATIPESKVHQALRIPDGISFPEPWPIAPILNKSRRFAEKFIAASSIR
jgi:hypothetical protein